MLLISAIAPGQHDWAPALGHVLCTRTKITRGDKKRMLNILFAKFPDMAFFKIDDDFRGSGSFVREKIIFK